MCVANNNSVSYSQTDDRGTMSAQENTRDQQPHNALHQGIAPSYVMITKTSAVRYGCVCNVCLTNSPILAKIHHPLPLHLSIRLST